MDFRKKTEYIKAEQFLGGEVEADRIIGWVQETFPEGKADWCKTYDPWGTVEVAPTPTQPKSRLRIDLPGYTTTVYDNEWAIIKSDGTLSALSNDEFRNEYEPHIPIVSE